MKRNPPRRPPAGKRPAAENAPQAAPAGKQLRTPFTRPVQVRHLAVAVPHIKPKRIHARRILPLVKEGAEREFHSVTARVAIRRLAVPRLAAADELTLVTNLELTSPQQQDTASNVGDPSVAVNDKVVLYTGNWYAAMSSDGGNTFNYINPTEEFPGPDANSQFCCDQAVIYIAKIDTFVWLMQYGPQSGNNFQRLAFAKTADVIQGRWRLFDLTTEHLGVPGAFLDFPDLAVGANFLYVTTNIFPDAQTAGSAVVRIPLAGIQSGQLTEEHFVSMDLQSFRVAQNSGTVAYFAAHQDTSTLRVFAWDEGHSAPAGNPIGVARWIGGNGYQSRTPDGRRWLDRVDPRITGATLAGNELYFAWAVDSPSNQRPRPFVQIARIGIAPNNNQDLTLLENINLFDPDSAIAYGALSTNADNEVGVSYMIGGGSQYPSQVVGFLTGTSKSVLAAAGERGPLEDPQTGKGEWGDYLTVRPVFPGRKLFAAAAYTMKGAGDGSNRDATPCLAIFGRAGGVAPGPAPARSAAVAQLALTGDDGPITDVNLLPVVSTSVATEIKAAAGVFHASLAPRAMPAPTQLELVTKPGVERWPVKTGTDLDVAAVGKNVIGGEHLGAGIVDATVEELISIPRPPEMPDPRADYSDFQEHRSAPVETTIWRVEGEITALKLETDGDYHLVLQGASGETMIGEIPTPTREFVDDSPWLANIAAARQAIDERLVNHLSRAAFAQLADKLVPLGAFSGHQAATPGDQAMFRSATAPSGTQMPAFKTRIPPTRARLTGPAFFDKVHGQMGVSQSNGIEIHPVLKIEWL
jgi:hypothetical protein